MPEEKRKIISVWLIIKDGKNQGKPILQKRSGKEKKFPYVCQATWAGKVELGEKIEDAIERECREELGERFAEEFDFKKLIFSSKHDFVRAEDGEVWESYDYYLYVAEKDVSEAKIHEMAFPEFVVEGADKLEPLKSDKDLKENIVLFDDQYKILKSILNGNSGNNK